MIRLYPEQLQEQLNEGLRSIYLLLGNDPFLIKESQDLLRQIARTKGFNEHHTIQIDSTTDWKEIFFLCQIKSLFSSKKILTLILSEENKHISEINEKLTILIRLLHSDLLLIVMGNNNLIKFQKNVTWLTRLSRQVALVMCQIPEKMKLTNWVTTRARQKNLQIDEQACQLLCYCYEGNLLSLIQVLDQLSLLWPDGKLTLPRVEKVVNDTAQFTPFHWVDALLSAKNKRALHILQQLRLEGTEPVILVRTLQRAILLLITLKRKSGTITSIHELFKKNPIFQYHKNIIIEAINRISHDQLRQAVHLLTRVELILKKDYGQTVWVELESLSLLLCKKTLADIFIDG